MVRDIGYGGEADTYVKSSGTVQGEDMAPAVPIRCDSEWVGTVRVRSTFCRCAGTRARYDGIRPREHRSDGIISLAQLLGGVHPVPHYGEELRTENLTI
jgi:hypothetical protein